MDLEERLVISKNIESSIDYLQKNKGKIVSYVLVTSVLAEDENEADDIVHSYAGGAYSAIGLMEIAKHELLNES